MDYIAMLEKLLDEYINESKARYEKYQQCCLLNDLYRELLGRLRCGDYDTIKDGKLGISILLSTIYTDDNYLNELYRVLIDIENNRQNQKDFKELVNHIYNDYVENMHELDLLLLQINEHKHRVSAANIVKLDLKNKRPIDMDKYVFNNIVRVIDYYRQIGKISDKDTILLINEFKLYNRGLLLANANDKEKKYFESLHDEIPNILNMGFYQYANGLDDDAGIGEKGKATIDGYAKTVFDVIKDDDCTNIIEEIKKYYEYYRLDNEEYKYLLIRVLDKLFSELHFYYQTLLDISVYNNGSDRPVAVSNYYSILDKYLSLFEYYNKVNETLTMDEISVEDATEDVLDKNAKQLIYSHSEVDLSKAKASQDMKNIPFEYYDRVLRLLTMYKDSTISEKEVKRIRIKNQLNYIELKDDQVRIVLKHVKDNIYVILGLFAKKDDNDPKRYDIIVKRKIPDISSSEKKDKEFKLAENYEKELVDKVTNKARKGNR